VIPISLKTKDPRTLLRSVMLLAGIAGVQAAGCNAILNNTPGKPEEKRAEVAPTQPGAEGGATATEPPASFPPAVDGGGEADGGADASGCTAEEQLCHGICVSVNDPLYGCGSPSCEPCKAAHGAATCRARACTLLSCDLGYGDCNANEADGCETDLSHATTCGACNAVCPATTPVCAPGGPSFQCTTGCTPAAPLLCGAECVSPLTSINHCGACNNKCPDVAFATVECTTGQCKFTCKPSYHACAGTCVVTTDPKACGPGCAVCPDRPYATATCQADACAFQCVVGHGNCNADPLDGCEATFATDPLNCGGCGISCQGRACNNGVCAAAPPPDGGI
jgi:hypothetical protein